MPLLGIDPLAAFVTAAVPNVTVPAGMALLAAAFCKALTSFDLILIEYRATPAGIQETVGPDF